MTRAWLTPEGEQVDLYQEALPKIAALEEAHARGARFLLIVAGDHRETSSWILACFHSPLTAVTIPPDLPPFALEKRLSQLPPGEVVRAECLPVMPSDRAWASPRPLADIWAVVFTSGSSGEPKGVALSGAALQASARAHGMHSRAARACWLLDLPLYHIGGLSVLARALFLDSPIALGEPRFQAKATARWIASRKVQGLSLVPTTLFRLLADTSTDLSSLQLILLGGAPASAALRGAAAERMAPIRLTYGMTEHCSQIATEREPGSGLEPLPGVVLRFGADGEILVRSHCLASGMFRDGSLTPLPLLEGFLPTGDLGEPSGAGLVVKGRKSEVVISGGKKIFPSVVEQALLGVPGIIDAAALGLPDEEWGEALCVAYVAEAGGLDERSARASLVERLEDFQLPKRWVRLERIPRSGAGKVIREELRTLVEAALRPSRS